MEFFDDFVMQQAALVAEWLRVGYVPRSGLWYGFCFRVWLETVRKHRPTDDSSATNVAGENTQFQDKLLLRTRTTPPAEVTNKFSPSTYLLNEATWTLQTYIQVSPNHPLREYVNP